MQAEAKKTEEDEIRKQAEIIINEVNLVLSTFPCFHGKINFTFKNGGICATEFSSGKQFKTKQKSSGI